MLNDEKAKHKIFRKKGNEYLKKQHQDKTKIQYNQKTPLSQKKIKLDFTWFKWW